MSESDKKPLSLEELQRKIEEANPKSNEKQGSKAKNAGLVKAMRVGSDLVAGIMVGTVMGYYLDGWLETEPLFLITGLFLGAATVFRSMWRGAMGNADQPEK